jgi:predicted nucleic-acid-binding Zn-ribbon protein
MNPIDEFRNAFFQKVIDEEKEREAEEKRIQSKCFHLYNIIDETFIKKDYQQRTCSKCGHSMIRRTKIWEGTKTCIVS